MQFLGNSEEWLHVVHVVNFKKDGFEFLSVFADLQKRPKINKDNLSIAAWVEPKFNKQRTEKRLIVIISSAVFNYVINNFWAKKSSWNENCIIREFKSIFCECNRERKTARRRGYSDNATKNNTKHITHNWMAKLARIRIAILRLLTPNKILRLLRCAQRRRVKIIVRETSDSSGGYTSL